ncbi:unnamed protein product [Urochloa humidicola]
MVQMYGSLADHTKSQKDGFSISTRSLPVKDLTQSVCTKFTVLCLFGFEQLFVAVAASRFPSGDRPEVSAAACSLLCSRLWLQQQPEQPLSSPHHRMKLA